MKKNIMKKQESMNDMEKEIESLSDKMNETRDYGNNAFVFDLEAVRESIRLIKKDIKGLNGEKALNLILEKRMGKELT